MRGKLWKEIGCVETKAVCRVKTSFMQESIDWSEPFEFVTKYAVDHKVDAAVQCHLNHGQIQIRIQILI